MLAVGAARWLPKPGALPPDHDPVIRVRNLFNPFVPLSDALTGIKRVHEEPFGFKRVEHAVRSLLGAEPHDRLDVIGGRVAPLPAGEGAPMWLDALSDGYQSMLAIAGEICEITSRWTNIQDAEGVVIADEIGAHLHPRWKMRVVDSLRRAFPGFSSSRAPTTRSASAASAPVRSSCWTATRTAAWSPSTTSPAPASTRRPVAHLKALRPGSTLDPALEAQVSEYYGLLSRRRLDASEQSRLEELRIAVGSRGILGETPRDQAIYQIIDEYLAANQQRIDEQWSQVSDETKRRVAALLKGEEVS